MPLKGFISSKDADNIKLTTGNAKLYHTDISTSDSSEVVNGVNTEKYFFDIAGENSQFYELDKTTLPKVVSKILPRPVNIEFVIPPKEYDGNMSVDMNTVVYRFKPTGSEDSGLVLGNQAWDNQGYTLGDMTIDQWNLDSSAYAYLFDELRVMDEPNWKHCYYDSGRNYDTDEPTRTYKLGEDKDRILTDKWIPLNLAGNVSFNMYSCCRSQRIGDRNWAKHDDMSLSVITNPKQYSRTCANYYEPWNITPEPNSDITITNNSSKSVDVRMRGANLFDFANVRLSTSIIRQSDTAEVRNYFLSSDDLKTSDTYYPLYHKGAKLTIALLEEMLGIEHIDEYVSLIAQYKGGAYVSSSSSIRIGVYNGSAIYTLMNYGHGYSLVKIPEAFHDGYLVAWRVGDTPSICEYFCLSLGGLSISDTEVNYWERIITIPPKSSHIFNSGNNSSLHLSTISEGVVDVRYYSRYEYNDFTGTLKATRNELEHDKYTTYRKGIATSDFTYVKVQVSDITFPENICMNEVVKMVISNPKLFGSKNSCYKINKVYGVSKLLPRRLTASIDVSSKIWDGDNSFKYYTSYELENVVEGDEVYVNPDRFSVYTYLSNVGRYSVRFNENENEATPALLGKDAYKYVLDKVNVTTKIITIDARPVKIVGGEIIFHINDISGHNGDNFITVTNTLVDYNNNEEIVNANVYTNPEMNRIWFKTSGSAMLSNLVSAINNSSNCSVVREEGDAVSITYGNYKFYDGDTMTLDHDDELLGTDGGNFEVTDTRVDYVVRIRHNN